MANKLLNRMFHNPEDIAAIKSSVFVNSMSGVIPKPPTFKKGFDGKEFSIPRYYPFEHSETQWIINMYRNNSWDRIHKIAVINPSYFSISYFQIPDSPGALFGQPMLHDKAVMYLTPLALALYLNLPNMVENLIEFRDQNGQRILSIYQPCYITNVFINSSECINDLMLIYSPCIMILRESFDCIRTMLIHGNWSPLKPFSFLYRRPFKICKFSYKDIIDYTVSQMVVKTSLKLPQLLQSMISSLSEEFSLMYYEQIISHYRDVKLEEWVSIPRRLLRFAFYYDKEMRLTSQIIRCVQVFQQHGFFLGPTRSCFQIIYHKRVQALKSNFHKKISKPDETRVVLDQDHCFCLLLALIQQASVFKHYIVKDRLLSIIPILANDTHWLLHFLMKKTKELSHYFSHLLEKVDSIPDYVFIQIKAVIMKALETKVILIHSLKDLNIRLNETMPVEDIISQFRYMYSNVLGYSIPELTVNNNSNKLMSLDQTNESELASSEESSLDDEDELEKIIKINYNKNNVSRQSSPRNISDDVIRFLEQETVSS